MRAFCSTDRRPTLTDLKAAIDKETEVELRDVRTTSDDNWLSWSLKFPSDAVLQVDVTSPDSDEELFSEELEEFREFVRDADAPDERREAVLKALDATVSIVAVELPPSDVEQGLRAANAVLATVRACCGGLVQADGEGFYGPDGQLLVSIP